MSTATTFDIDARTSARRLSLADLSRMSVEELGGVYARGTVPASLSALDGDPIGRMLAVRGVERLPVAGPLRSFAAAASFPWEGKSFRSESATRGTGINRVKLGGRHRLFPFETRIEPSAIDGKDTIVLDYGSPDNPGFIQAIHDELRQVAPGLFLGPAMWKGQAGPSLVLWFAIATKAA
jgi:hypothetical protein